MEGSISEDLEKKLQICNNAHTQKETKFNFWEYSDVRTHFDDLVYERDEEVTELRHSLSTKESYSKLMNCLS